MADDPQLVVAITARLDQFEKQMKEAGLIAERGVKAMESQLSTFTLGTAFGTLLAKVMTAAFDEIQKAITQTFDIMLKLDDAARKTGLSFEQLQRIGGAAMAGGLGQGEALSGLNKMAATMDEMNRSTTTLSKYLDANNVKFRDQAGHVVNVDKGLELAATLMARAASESEKIKIAQLFGLTEKWVAVLGQGAGEFQKMKDSMPVKDLEEAVRHAKALQVLANRISAEFGNWGTDLIVNVLPALQQIAAWFAAIASGLASITKGGPLETVTADLEKKWQRLHGFIKDTTDALNRPKITVSGPGTNFPATAGAGGRDALTRAEDTLKRRTALLEEEARTVAMTTSEQEKARAVTELLTAAERANIPVTAAMRAEFERLGAGYGTAAQNAKVAQAQFAETVSNSREFGQVLADAFKGAAIEGKKLDEVMKSLVNRLTSRAIDKLFDLMFAPTPGVGGGSLFMKLLEGRAAGGPVAAGTPYMVGERGPELFVPNRGGMIVPNSATKGGGGAAIKQTVVVNDYSGQAKVRQTNTAEGGGVEVFVPALEQMLASGVARGRGALSKSVDARRRGTNLYG